MIFQEKTKIISNVQIISCFFKMVLEANNIVPSAKPGQFLHIRISDGNSLLLRRPFSIHRVDNPSLKARRFEILYKVVGKGTELLSHKRPGDYLDILGPLGNGFDYRSQISKSQQPVLIAGGIGVAPLLFLAEDLIHRQYIRSNILVLLGAKTKKQIFCEKEFEKLGCNVKISTDDGSRGFKGKVASLLEYLLSTVNCQLSTIYACGPREMLEEVAALSKSKRIASFASFEEHLACGIGACLGCAIKTRYGYKKVCSDGPVFNLKDIVF
jgi:dihydroorotate dehydrogenase electron transfer subunit